MRAMRCAMLAVATMLAGPAAAEGPQVMGLWAQAPATSNGVRGMPLADRFSLRLDPGSSPSQLAADGVDRPLRKRLLSAMVDYFPLGGNNGFHFSGGTLRGPKMRMGAEAEWLNPSKLVTVRTPGNSTFRGNVRRATPALTMGYSVSPLRNLDFGLEVGEALGRINSMGPSAGVRRFGDLATNRFAGGGGSLNPVVHLALGMRF